VSQAATVFALFVSCVPGRPVTRYGSRVTIGAYRDPATSKFAWEPETVVAIPEPEFRRYRREYTSALRDGSLRSRSEADWQAQCNAADAAVAAHVEAKAKAQNAAATTVVDRKKPSR